MSEVFMVSDLHLGHTNAVEKFIRDADGRPLRDFPSVKEMDETIITNWNSVVGKNDKVFVLGDVVINKKNLPLLHQLQGNKILIFGNHDNQPAEVYKEYFQTGYAMKEYDGCVLTHIPVHASQVGYGNRWKVNIHGHLHDKHIMWYSADRTDSVRDDAYYNVSIDCFACGTHTGMNYFPKPWSEIKKESGI